MTSRSPYPEVTTREKIVWLGVLVICLTACAIWLYLETRPLTDPDEISRALAIRECMVARGATPSQYRAYDFCRFKIETEAMRAQAAGAGILKD